MNELQFTPMSPFAKIYFILGFRVFLMLGTPLSAAMGSDSRRAHLSLEIVLTHPPTSWHAFVEESGNNKFAKSGYRKRYIDQELLVAAALPKCI